MTETIAQLNSRIYRPAGVRQCIVNSAWSNGGRANFVRQIDLSLPICALMLVFEGRLVIGGANVATGAIEGLLNLISRVAVTGTNKRAGGNVVLWDTDLATLYAMQHMFQLNGAYFTINDTQRAVPTTPFPAIGANGYMDVATGTYDYRIAVKIPFYPFNAPKSQRAAFAVRAEEYADSLQVQLEYGRTTDAANACSLGTGAAGTTYVNTSYGAGTGTPMVSLYAIPIEMGTLKDNVLPGMLSRVQAPLNSSLLTSAGTNVNLLNLQKQPTTRLILKTGTVSATLSPAFTTLSDANVTSIGLSIGGKSALRETDPISCFKASQVEEYGRPPIQGYVCADFLESFDFNSAFNGDQIGAGSTFQLQGIVAALANAQATVIQEQLLFRPDGSIYNPS